MLVALWQTFVLDQAAVLQASHNNKSCDQYTEKFALRILNFHKFAHDFKATVGSPIG
jgi:hypothetical protein